MTISFSYVFLKGFTLGSPAPSSSPPPVTADVHRPSLATSPRRRLRRTVSAMSSALCPVAICVKRRLEGPHQPSRQHACLWRSQTGVVGAGPTLASALGRPMLPSSGRHERGREARLGTRNSTSGKVGGQCGTLLAAGSARGRHKAYEDTAEAGASKRREKLKQEKVKQALSLKKTGA